MAALVLEVLGLLVFTALLAIVSAAEQTFLSLTETQMRRLGDRGNGKAKRVAEFVRDPHRVIVTTILSSGVFAAGAVACFFLLVAGPQAGPAAIAATALVGGVLLAVIGRALPRTFASAAPERTALGLVGVYSVVNSMFAPVSFVTRQLLMRVSDEAKDDLIATEEFKAVAEDDEETPRLQDEKRELLHSIFEFGGTTAKEVMVPRIDMVMADADTTRKELLELIARHGHSRIPIYDGSVDKILGAVHVKQIVMETPLKGDDAPARDFVRPVKFVPETKKIDELLHEFQEEKNHLAIIVDEYGGTSGMATLEDVLEEIVGEIEDEYDNEEKLLEPLADGSYRVAAKIDLDDLNEEMNLQLPTENSDTLGGFICEVAGRVPVQGESVSYQGLRFIVDRVQRQRIIRVRITNQEEATA